MSEPGGAGGPLTRRQLREQATAKPPARKRGTSRPKTRRVSTRTLTRPAAKPAKKSVRARVASNLFSAVAMLFAGALVVGMSIPANAFLTETLAVSSEQVAKQPGQSLQVSASAVGSTPVRDSFSVTSYAELLRLKYGSRSYAYSTTTGAIRWPFPYAVPITDGWGERVSPCRGCSSYHRGVDFTPGNGVPIYAIADGVVSYSEISDSGYGNHVIIDHQIGGQLVQSLYAHMQMNSSPLTTGAEIKVGDFVGLVGDTGASVGAHLHFEIRPDGVQVDPYAWLQANAVN